MKPTPFLSLALTILSAFSALPPAAASPQFAPGVAPLASSGGARGGKGAKAPMAKAMSNRFQGEECDANRPCRDGAQCAMSGRVGYCRRGSFAGKLGPRTL